MIEAENIQPNRGVLDLRSERLYREAEDEFYFFDNCKAVEKKLKKALDFSPSFVKALVLLANLYLYCGKIEKSLDFYKQAELIDANDVKVLAGLANLYEMLGEYKHAYDYVDKALLVTQFVSPALKKSLIELKSIILFKLKKYDEAKLFIEKSRSVLTQNDINEIKAGNFVELNHKLKLQQKIKNMHLSLIK